MDDNQFVDSKAEVYLTSDLKSEIFNSLLNPFNKNLLK